MKVNPDIFKAYDIRGRYPEEVNQEVAERLGSAFFQFLIRKRLSSSKSKIKQGLYQSVDLQAKRHNPALKIVVGRDNRSSSPLLFKALAKGIIQQGGIVVDIGCSTSPMFYFAVAYYGFDGGINITASHNPSRYNGFKLVGPAAVPISGRYLKEIRRLVEKSPITSGTKVAGAKEKGKIIKKRVIRDYIKFVISGFDLREIKPFKITVTLPEVLPSTAIRKILAKLPCKICYSNCPKQDLGIAFDGDGDRIIFIDEKGKKIPGDLITAVVAKLILKQKPGKKVLYDVRSSNIVKETIRENKGIPIMGKVGHSLIKEKMRNKDIYFAGELSGHYYLKPHYFCESPFFVLFKILKELSKTDCLFSELIKPFKRYYHSGEINFKLPVLFNRPSLKSRSAKKKLLEKIAKKYKNGKISKIDGLRIDFQDWWFNLRFSNTEPLLKLVLEARNKALLKKKQKEITKTINSCKVSLGY